MAKHDIIPGWVKEAMERFRRAPWAIWLPEGEKYAALLDTFWTDRVRKQLKLPDVPFEEIWRTREYAKTVDFLQGGVPRMLNPAQLRVVEAFKGTKEVWFQAANRLGKSQLGATVTSWFAHGIDPLGIGIPEAPNLIWCGVPDYHGHAQSVTIPFLRFFLGSEGVWWKRGDFRFEVCSHISKTGVACKKKCPEPSQVLLKSYDSGAEKWQGSAPNFVWPDETLPEAIYSEISMRVGIGHSLVQLYTLTPLRTAGWIKAELYDRWIDAGRPNTRAFVEGSIWENIYLPLDLIDEQREKYKHDPDQMKARLWGRWSMTPGVVFPMLDGSVHRVPDFEIPGVHRAPAAGEEAWTLYRALDPGIRNPTAVLWVACAPSGLCYVYREAYIKDRSIPEVCEMALTAETPHEKANGFVRTVIDPAASQRDLADGSARIDQYARNGLVCLKANNERVGGIDKLKQAFAWDKDEAGNFRMEPKYRFFNSCPLLWDELRRYSWLPHKDNAVRGPRDDAQKKEDHGVDAIRYVENSYGGPAFYSKSASSEPIYEPDPDTGW